MKIISVVAAMSILVCGCSTQKQRPQQAKETTIPENVNRSLIIYYKGDASVDSLLDEAKNYGAKVIYRYDTLKGIAITVPEDKTMDEAIEHFKKVKGVLEVSRDSVSTLQKN